MLTRGPVARLPSRRGGHQISNWHAARVTNAPTEAVNNLVKRAAFGFTNFANYRIRALLYAGKPMRVRIEVGSTGGGGSQTRAPPCGGGFPVECLPAGAGPVMSLDRSV